MRPTILLLAGLCTLLPSAVAGAQQRSNEEWLRNCRDNDRGSDQVAFCDVQEFTLGARERVTVDGRQNGSVSISGWDRSDIVVRARIQAWAESESDARALAGEITIARDGTIEADGPNGRSWSRRDRRGWAVSYDISVPRQTDLDIETMNGSVRITGVRGRLGFDATNGSIVLDDVGGTVRGETTNGSVSIALTGTQWNGSGLEVETTNGAVRITMPDGYNARLETGTVNGGMNFDFPITVQGKLSRREIATDIGRGGPTIRATTTNGSVSVRRR